VEIGRRAQGEGRKAKSENPRLLTMPYSGFNKLEVDFNGSALLPVIIGKFTLSYAKGKA
jgi:hypothetical protein